MKISLLVIELPEFILVKCISLSEKFPYNIRTRYLNLHLITLRIKTLKRYVATKTYTSEFM